jgi:hypothetical protein
MHKGRSATELCWGERAKLDEAIMWQDKRTADREARGVEGLNKA